MIISICNVGSNHSNSCKTGSTSNTSKNRNSSNRFTQLSFEKARIIAAKKTDKVAASAHIPGARRRESKRRRPFAVWQAIIKCCNSASEIKGNSNSNSYTNCKAINSGSN